MTAVTEGKSVDIPDGDSLVLAVNSSAEPFSAQNGINTYVIAELTSKEVH